MNDPRDEKTAAWTEHGDYKPGPRLRRIEPRKYEIFPELADWFIFDQEARVYPLVHAGREGRLIVSDELGRTRIDSSMTHDRIMPAFDRCSPPDVLLEYMDRHAVDMACIAQGKPYGYLNEYVAGCVHRWPGRFVGTAVVSMDWDDLTMMELETWNSCDLSALNIRLEPLSLWLDAGDESRYTPDPVNPGFRFNAPYMDRFWNKLSAWKWVVTLDIARRIPQRVLEQLLGDLEQIVQQYREINFVQENLCYPSFTGFEQRARLCRDYANMFTEIGVGSFGIFPLEDSRVLSAQPYLRQFIDEFAGENSILFGSGYPYALIHATYWQLLDWVFRQCEFLTEVQRQKILGLNAVKVHHLENQLERISARKRCLKEKQGAYYDPYCQQEWEAPVSG